MKVAEIQSWAERQPFRPFTVRLNNGARYTFGDPRNFGAPRDYRVIVYFGASELVVIDPDSIAEIIQN
ncbi:MAG: hypothetical protein HYY24_06160 [Verrucomicrobia bacterium]|nr:hypothetical protein [Verrucomicrobiota bacterium]